MSDPIYFPGVGYLAEQGLAKVAIPTTVAALINGNYSFANLISATPSISGAVVSSGTQEMFQNKIDKIYEDRSFKKYNK